MSEKAIMIIVDLELAIALISVYLLKSKDNKNENTSDTSDFKLLFSTWHVLNDNKQQLKEKALKILFLLSMYSYMIYNLWDVYLKDLLPFPQSIKELVEGTFIKELVEGLFVFWIFDILFGFIIYLANVVISAAVERHKTNLRNFYVIEGTIISCIFFDSNFKSFGRNFYLIIISAIILIILGREIWIYLKSLVIKLFKGYEYYRKKTAIQECMLIYMVLVIYLADLLLFASYFWVGLFKETSDITMFKCLKFCILTFIGMNSTELTPISEVSHILTIIIRLIGIGATGFLAVEIFSKVSEKNRSEKEVYWQTRYELWHCISLITDIQLDFQRINITDKLDNKSIDALNEKINEEKEKIQEQDNKTLYYAEYRKRMHAQLDNLGDMFQGLSDGNKLKLKDIRNQLDNIKKEFIRIEKDFQTIVEEKTF